MFYLSHLTSGAGRARPQWPFVHERLTHQSCNGPADRKLVDWLGSATGPPRHRTLANEWLGSRYTRGHLASAGAHKGSSRAMQRTFSMDNMLPQEYTSNAGEWWRLELLTRDLTNWYRRVHIINGALLLPLSVRTWILDGHRLEGVGSAPLRDRITFEDWKAGGAWRPPTIQADASAMEHLSDIRDMLKEEVKSTCSSLPSLGVKKFNGRVDPIETQRLGGGQFVPTHFFKVVLCFGRRRRPLKGEIENRPPRRMLEAFLVPNSIVPIPLPMSAYRISISPLERLSGLDLGQMRRKASPWWQSPPPSAATGQWNELYTRQTEGFHRMMEAWWRSADKLNEKIKNPSIRKETLEAYARDERALRRDLKREARVFPITNHYRVTYSLNMARRLTSCWGQALVMWAGHFLDHKSPGYGATLDAYRSAAAFDDSNPSPLQLETRTRWEALDANAGPGASHWRDRLRPRMMTQKKQSGPKKEGTHAFAETGMPVIKGSLPPWMK